MDDEIILDQIKRLGVVEDQLKTIRDLMERAWFILDPPLAEAPNCPAEIRLEDLRHVMKELDHLVPYHSRDLRLKGNPRPASPPRRVSPSDFEEAHPTRMSNGYSNGNGHSNGNGRYNRV